ncbi:unnamed protein product [Symbiodinium necroappetens]|uniref:Reverse transcriptase domain-containing protein n=1 Tax=Symbiodinium necroappetens TaxID=1628268 RepID=A0A813ARN7_9DINO|nr:unnamed protein product [Symbiodinium necroappetens]
MRRPRNLVPPYRRAGDCSQVFTALDWGQPRVDHVALRTYVTFNGTGTLKPPVTRLNQLCHRADAKCALFCLRQNLRLVPGVWAFALRRGRAVLALAHYVKDLRESKKGLRKAIRWDIGARIRDAADTAQNAGTGSVVSRLQCLLRPSARRARPPRSLPGLTKEDGTPTLEPEAVEAAWVAHFSSIEDGSTRSPEDIVAACLHTQRSRNLEDLELETADLPTRSELELAFRETMLHRAFGTDGVPAEALRGAPGAAAAAIFPIILKCALRLEEPLHFKGGSLYAVWKGKASPGACSSYRGILVSSTVGKAYHRIIRARNVPALRQAATPLQIGGLPKSPVTLAAQVVRLHQSCCKGRGTSQAVLFLDLKEAFYRIVRPLVTGFSGTDEDIATIVRSVDLPPGVMHDLRAHLEEVSLLKQSGSTDWAVTATTEALHHTWFRFEHGTLTTETGIGTRSSGLLPMRKGTGFRLFANPLLGSTSSCLPMGTEAFWPDTSVNIVSDISARTCSRRAEDAGKIQAPVLQASGPKLAPREAIWLDADERPIAEVLDCLSHVGVDTPALSDSMLWQQLRVAFSCVCASTIRLRVTAEAFLHGLVDRDDLVPSIRLRLEEAMTWVQSADIVSWLVPVPETTQRPHNTFQDCETVLSLLEVAHIPFPAPALDTAVAVRIVVGPAAWCRGQENEHPNSVIFALEECTQLIAHGHSPSFFDGPYDDVVFMLCVDGWSGFLSVPAPHTPARMFHSLLASEVLCGDVVRFALRLWGLGTPTMLLYPALASGALAPLGEIAALACGAIGPRRYLRNGWPHW